MREYETDLHHMQHHGILFPYVQAFVKSSDCSMNLW